MQKQISEKIAELRRHGLRAVGDMGMVRQQVLYIPSHLQKREFLVRSWGYPNGIQPGFIYGYNSKNEYFVRYWRWDHISETYLPELRTLANSELTPMNLYYFNFFEESVVDDAMRLLQGQSFQS